MYLGNEADIRNLHVTFQTIFRQSCWFICARLQSFRKIAALSDNLHYLLSYQIWNRYMFSIVQLTIDLDINMLFGKYIIIYLSSSTVAEVKWWFHNVCGIQSPQYILAVHLARRKLHSTFTRYLSAQYAIKTSHFFPGYRVYEQNVKLTSGNICCPMTICSVFFAIYIHHLRGL